VLFVIALFCFRFLYYFLVRAQQHPTQAVTVVHRGRVTSAGPRLFQPMVSPYIIIISICPSLPAFPTWSSSSHPLSTKLYIAAMSGAATSAGASKLQQFMNHPAGPKTVFFWAPMMKWCLVLAGVKDMGRPADKLSVSQNLALAATGFIWVRYSLVITPVNYSLAAVNFFVGATGLGQLARIAHYQSNLKTSTSATPTP